MARRTTKVKDRIYWKDAAVQAIMIEASLDEMPKTEIMDLLDKKHLMKRFLKQYGIFEGNGIRAKRDKLFKGYCVRKHKKDGKRHKDKEEILFKKLGRDRSSVIMTDTEKALLKIHLRTKYRTFKEIMILTGRNRISLKQCLLECEMEMDIHKARLVINRTGVFY